jgi:tight adherence protein B
MTGVCILVFIAAALIVAPFFETAVKAAAGAARRAHDGLRKVVSLLKKRTEREKFEEQLSDALFVISSSVKAGSNILQALENASSGQPPLSEYFSWVIGRTRLGVPLREALSELERKVGSKELRITVTAINTALEYGGGLSENLSRIAITMKERKKLKDKMKAATAQGRLSAATITAMPFLLLGVLNLMEPAIFGLLFSTWRGRLMLCTAALMAVTGNYFIMRIVRIKE